MLHDLTVQKLRVELGFPQAPETIWQQPFDYIPGHCERIVKNGSNANYSDLTEYFLDYQYMEVQLDLFRFILPIAVEAWADKLLSDQPTWVFHEMWQAFDRRPPYPEYLTAKQYAALNNHFAQSMLLRMARENSLVFQGSEASPYEWMSQLASMIFLFPVVEQIWDDWWTLETEWQAVCGLQWWSGFMYDRNESPIFGAYSAKHGGGNCSPYETEHVQIRPANTDNALFLKSKLNLKLAEVQILKCCDRLETLSLKHVGEQIRLDLEDQSIILEQRIGKFIRLLGMENAHKVTWWSDIPD